MTRGAVRTDDDSVEHGAVVEVPGVLRASISDGARVVYEPLAGSTESALRRSLIGAAMGVVLQQRGLLVLHAGAVSIGDGAVAFAGASGVGKSTLTDAFERAGHSCFADDLTLIDTAGGTPEVVPGIHTVRLRADSAGHAGWSTAQRRPTGGDVKAARPLTPAASHAPLRALYFLGWGDELAISRLEPPAALPRMVGATRANALLEDPALAARHLRQCGVVLAHARCAELRRPRDFERLGDVVDAIVRDASPE